MLPYNLKFCEWLRTFFTSHKIYHLQVRVNHTRGQEWLEKLRDLEIKEWEIVLKEVNAKLAGEKEKLTYLEGKFVPEFHRKEFMLLELFRHTLSFKTIVVASLLDFITHSLSVAYSTRKRSLHEHLHLPFSNS